METHKKKNEKLDFVGAFDQGWVQYKSNFLQLIPFGLAAAIPPLFFLGSISFGVAATIIFEGFFLLLLSEKVVNATNGIKTHYTAYSLLNHLKNGVLLSLFLFPLLVFGFVFLIIPSVLLFSLFMFSFFMIVVKEKFAIDSCMESLRLGFGYRLHFFLFALIFYSVTMMIYIVSEGFPILFIPLFGAVLPYFFIVIYEFFEQLEKK